MELKISSGQKDDQTKVIALSKQFLHQWNQLVSTTNWEKGKIICRWRDALQAEGFSPHHFSDEAWSRHIGDVTPQHAGRLRKVFVRFGSVWQEYPGLYWSHFYAALDWDDPELWLEGAIQNQVVDLPNAIRSLESPGGSHACRCSGRRYSTGRCSRGYRTRDRIIESRYSPKD